MVFLDVYGKKWYAIPQNMRQHPTILPIGRKNR